MNVIGEVLFITLILFMVFIFQGDPDIWSLAHDRVIAELKK